MSLQFPWNNISDIKFNNGELLNSITMNIHLKKIYDNIYYLNNHSKLSMASTSTTGATLLATVAEIAAGSVDNKAVTTSAFNQILANVDQTANYTNFSIANITDSIKMIHGEIITATASPCVVLVNYGVNSFSNTLLNFSMYAVTTLVAPSNLKFRYYRYLNSYDNSTDFTVLSTLTPVDPRYGAYIVYDNTDGIMSKIRWSAIGI